MSQSRYAIFERLRLEKIW